MLGLFEEMINITVKIYFHVNLNLDIKNELLLIITEKKLCGNLLKRTYKKFCL